MRKAGRVDNGRVCGWYINPGLINIGLTPPISEHLFAISSSASLFDSMYFFGTKGLKASAAEM